MEQTHLLVLLLVLPVLFLVVQHKKRKASKTPPGPYPLPILGNFLHLREKPHIALANLANVHGPLMSLRLGEKLVVVGSSQAAATEILRDHGNEISGRVVPQTLGALISKGVVDHLTLIAAEECDAKWKMMRTIVKSELFSSKAIDCQVLLREEKVKELVHFLRIKEGSVVKIGEVVFTTAVNVISRLIFSKDFINIEDEGRVGGVKDQIRRIERLAGTPNLGDFYPILNGLDVQGLGKKFTEYSKGLFPYWEVFMDEREEGKSCHTVEEGDFLHALLANGFTKDQINLFVTEIFITGIDTIGAAAEWTMSELMKNSDVMSKLCEELAKEVGENVVRESDLPRLPYLNACVKETLRLHPPVAIMHRRATETCQVMNYTIHKGTQVWVNLWAIGREAAKWDDPFTFKPSRFVENNLDFKGGNYEYLPFGSGKRICPGLPLAAKLVPLIVASLVHCFDWHLPDNVRPDELDMNEKLGITLQREKPLLLIPKSKGQ